MLDFGIPLRVGLRRIRLDLTRSLVLGQVELLLDLALTTAKLLIVLFFLEGRANFRFEVLGAFVDISNVGLQFGSAFFEPLDGGLQ